MKFKHRGVESDKKQPEPKKGVVLKKQQRTDCGIC